MTSPYSTGGGGTQFETRVFAYCLAGVLTQSPVRALPGIHATKAVAQRADLGEPLDDVIVSGLDDDGRETKLALQVKNTLRFTDKDQQWIDVLHQAWASFSADEFDQESHRLGVVIGSYNARADKYFQAVLAWAEHSPSADDFFTRISCTDFAHQDQRQFVEITRNILSQHAGAEISDEQFWCFLRVFRILHFDFQNEEASRDVEHVIDRIRNALPTDARSRADSIWDHLIVRAGQAGPTAGGDTRETLVASLRSKSLPTLYSGSLWQDVQKIDRESRRALTTVKPDIQGLRLRRNKPFDAVVDAMAEGRFIQIDGEPGSGKSALLRQIAEQQHQLGSVFFLKDSRILSGGWAAHAGQMGLSDNLVELLHEFACIGPAVLFIDGIDKISEHGVRVTINDIVQVIATEPSLSDWKILVTVREQNLDHVATWLNPEALKQLSIKTVTVPSLDRQDLQIVADAFPRLRPLLMDTEQADIMLRRPFFLDSIIRLAGQEGKDALPASEAELLQLWWQLGGSDEAATASAQDRRNALIDLSERLLEKPSSPIGIKDISPQALETLKSAGVLRDASLGHTVIFAHDIYEEWALCEWLMSRLPDVSKALRSVAEPQELVRPLQLLGSYQLETHNSDKQWRQLYADCEDESLRPIWQRTLLTSCLRSTQSRQILNKLTAFLTADDNAVLKKLLNALQTLEVVPNPIFLDEKTLPDLEPDERVKFAQHAALPKVFTWVRFLDWLFQNEEDPQPELIPNLVPVFKTWQSFGAGQNVRHCKRIGEIASRWLAEFEDARHPVRFEDRRNPFGLSVRYEKEKELEDSIRSLFLSSVGDIPELVGEYLREKSTDRLAHVYREKILPESNGLARHVPTELVDYITETFFEHPKDDESPYGRHDMMERELGIAGFQSFYPASPYQSPFLALLRQNEAQGLRLIRAVCNHSIDVWRWHRERNDHYQKGVTPLPLELEFSWGKQSFWGDDQVYSWFRGGWGNSASNSALMALEWWAFERLEAGDEFDAVLQKIIEGNDSVAALGMAVSLCISNQEKAMSHLLNFITCPHIWEWDLNRSMADNSGSHSNEIADWLRNRHLMMPVRTLNQREHRKIYIRDLIPYFVFSGDAELTEKYKDAVRTMPERLPFAYEEEQKDKDRVAAVKKSVDWMVEQADPQYWRTEKMDDGRIKFWNDPPSADAPERVEVIEDLALNERYLRLAFWAQKSLDEGELRDDVGLAEALDEAKELDADDIFEPAGIDYRAWERAAAIAGVAYCLAKFADGELWTDDTERWVVDTIRRASNSVDNDDITYRGTALSMHPLIFAVHASAALIVRDVKRSEFQEMMCDFALHPFESVGAAVAESMNGLEQFTPQLPWEIFVLFVRRCIIQENERPNYHSTAKDGDEDARDQKLVNDAVKALEAGKSSRLPQIPLPWVSKKDATGSDGDSRDDYIRNVLLFQDHIARKTVLKSNMDTLMSVPSQRAQILNMLQQLTEMTFQEMLPPFAEKRRDYEGRVPYEWVYGYFFRLGATCRFLSKQEIEEHILPPLLNAENESALMAMQSFAGAVLAHCILPPAELTDEDFAIWEMISNWIIENPEGQHLRHVDREFASCVYLTLFCFAPDFQPLVCVVEEGWMPLDRFAPIISRVVEKFGSNKSLYLGVARFLLKGGMDLAPDPVLSWLEQIAKDRKSDQEFWDVNGDETVDVLKKILNDKSDHLDGAHRNMISLIVDILVDNGVRGAGFLQQEQYRRDAV